MIAELNYSYFNALTGSSFAAFKAGKIETIIVIIIEHSEINKIDGGLISEGIVLKKYISSGNKLMLNKELKNCLKLSNISKSFTHQKNLKVLKNLELKLVQMKFQFII